MSHPQNERPNEFGHEKSKQVIRHIPEDTVGYESLRSKMSGQRQLRIRKRFDVEPMSTYNLHAAEGLLAKLAARVLCQMY